MLSYNAVKTGLFQRLSCSNGGGYGSTYGNLNLLNCFGNDQLNVAFVPNQPTNAAPEEYIPLLLFPADIIARSVLPLYGPQSNT
jgi:hypothetical protein